MRNGSATAGNSGGAMSRAAPWLVSAPEPMTTSPARTSSWIEPDVPIRMTVVMPTWTSSLTTMLIDGAPIPLVAHTTGAPPGSAGEERVEAAVAGQRLAAAEVRPWRSARSVRGRR